MILYRAGDVVYGFGAAFLFQCASCLSSAVAIMSDLLSCTCIGKPLTCSGCSSPGGGSTPVSSPALQQETHGAMQQQQPHLLGKAQEEPAEQQGCQQQLRESRPVTGSSSGGVSFTRSGGQQQLERQSSLLPDGVGDDDEFDSDDESTGFFNISISPGESLDECLKRHLEGDDEDQDDVSSPPATESSASPSGRPDISTVSSEYIKRALAGLPEQPPVEGGYNEERQPLSPVQVRRQQEQQQNAEQQPTGNDRHQRQQRDQQLLQKEEKHDFGGQEETQEAGQQHEPQGASRWRADSCLSLITQFNPPENTREWLDSLERGQFVELYFAPRVRV